MTRHTPEQGAARQLRRRRALAAAGIVALSIPVLALLRTARQLDAAVSRRPAVGAALSDPELGLAHATPATLVVFTRAGCSRCERTVSLLSTLESGGTADFAVKAIVAGAAGRDLGATYFGARYLRDDDGVLSHRYGVVQTPLTLLIRSDARSDARIAAIVEGERTEASWRRLLAGDAGRV